MFVVRSHLTLRIWSGYMEITDTCFCFFQGPVITVAPTPAAPAATCQPITVSLCSDQPYSETVLPNILGHTTQEDAGLVLQTFAPLIQVGCSTHLKPFLCSVYTPKCVLGKAQPPCRTLCEQARSGCESLMNKIGLQWPEPLRCEAFTTDSCEHVSLLFLGFWDVCKALYVLEATRCRVFKNTTYICRACFKKQGTKCLAQGIYIK